MPTPATFAPGFRLSLTDCLVLASAVVFALFTMQSEPMLASVVGFTVLHFFLFCNVVRMARVRELIWAGFFVGLSLLSVQWQVLPWWQVFAASGVLTLILLGFELRSPGYHGVFWQRVNPQLRQWWEREYG